MEIIYSLVHFTSFMDTVDKLNYIKEILEAKGVKQNWLAAQLSVTDNTVSNWCNNRSQPSLPVLKQIAGLLSVDIVDLIKPVKK